jgi:hypothetical protein
MRAGLKVPLPFFGYYGGKFRAAPHYPAPAHRTIIEPFAGSAGYALRYHERQVILVERFDVLAEMWRYLIDVSEAELLRIPAVDSVDDLPSWVPAGGRSLVGFSMNGAPTAPRKTLSAGCRKLREMGRKFQGWTEARKERTAASLRFIRHWQIIDGDYTAAPDIEATWFVDPPYSVAGSYYIHRDVDYASLGAWCRVRSGQVIVCENEGATWLPFRPFMLAKASSANPKTGGRTLVSREAIYEQ